MEGLRKDPFLQLMTLPCQSKTCILLMLRLSLMEMDIIASAFNIGNAQSWKCTVTSCAGTGSTTGLRQAATIGLARQ